MSLASIAANVGRSTSASSDVIDIISFVESDWGLGLRLYPVQRVILKAHYGLALDDNLLGFPLDVPVPRSHPKYSPDLVDEDGYYKYRILVTDWRRENERAFTEAGYLKFLHSEGRCNIDRVIPGKERRQMVLSIGRRSGKTLITSCIVAYEAYKLIKKGDPQKFYGTSTSNTIQLISVATDKDQASLLYKEAAGHFQKCKFFKPYMANSTQSYAAFQTPRDIEVYGPHSENSSAKCSINVTFKSCVAKGLRGGNNILVALDEAAHFGEKGQASADEVYQAVAPSNKTFSPVDPNNSARPIGENEGRLIMISSPLGKQGLFYKQFMIGFSGGIASHDVISVQAPTWEVNPSIPAGTFEAEYLKDQTTFFTEFGAVFTDRTRGWLEQPEDLLACVDPAARPKLRAPPRSPHFLGLDVGLVGDYTALAIGHNDDKGRVVLDHIDRICAGEGEFEDVERLDFDEVVDWISTFAKKFYVSDGIFDQWMGIPLEQALQKRQLGQLKSVHHTPQLASQMFQNFKTLMLDQRLVLYDHPILEGHEHALYLEELLELQAEYKSKYIIKVEAPPVFGKHDDFSDALVRMVWCASQNSTKKHSVSGLRRGTSAPSVLGSAKFGGLPNLKTMRSGSHESRMIPKKRGWR